MMGGIFTMMDISASGLAAERARMTMHANNLANAQTTRDADGKPNPYRRERIIFRPGAKKFTGSDKLGVSVDSIEKDFTSDFRKVFQPGHPDANEKGEVLYPNVSVPVEMVDMMVAQRAFEANLTAMDAAKAVMRGALQIIA